MNTIDIIILLPLLFGAYKGFKKGFLMELVTVLAFVLAIIGGLKLLALGIDLLDQYFDINAKILPYISFGLIFIGIILLIHFIGKMLKKVLSLTILGSMDALAGAVLGLLKWAFGISMVLWLISNVGLITSTEYTNNSLLYSYIANIAPTFIEYIAILWPMAQDLLPTIKEIV